MKIPSEVTLHLETAEKLLEGIRETLTVLKKDGQDGWIPLEHSCASVKRRVVQTRQELLQVLRELEKSDSFYNWKK